MVRSPRFRSTLAPLALVLLTCALAVSVPRAGATDPFPNVGIATLSSDHFMIHYDRTDHSTLCPTVYITQEQAGRVLGMAERAYDLYRSWGYSAPILDSADGDSLIDISVDEFDQVPNQCISFGSIALSIPREVDGTLSRWNALINPVLPAGAGEVHLDSQKGLLYHVLAHEVFHLFQHAIYPTNDQWLEEGTAEWAAVRADGSASNLGQIRAVDCVGAECGETEADRAGYPGWLLWEYLAEGYGDTAVKAVWDRVAAVNDPTVPATSDLSDVLATHSTTLATFFNDFTTARLTGSMTFPGLAGVLPQPQTTVSVGAISGPLPTSVVAVNHLGVGYVGLQHGGDTASPCYAATLTLNVTMPSGITATPYFYANTTGAVAKALTISGSTASLTTPWNTCAGSPTAYLSLPNDTLNANGKEFVVTGSTLVDTSTPATPTAPPTHAPIYGPVVNAPTVVAAPKVTLHAPEVLKVNAKTRQLRFIVFSTGDGKLRGTLGSTALGSATLQAGNNDVRFLLPPGLLKARRTSSTSVLQLTSYSPSGARGMTITRRVTVKPAKRTKRR
jgi:hypothetical protein